MKTTSKCTNSKFYGLVYVESGHIEYFTTKKEALDEVKECLSKYKDESFNLVLNRINGKTGVEVEVDSWSN